MPVTLMVLVALDMVRVFANRFVVWTEFAVTKSVVE